MSETTEAWGTFEKQQSERLRDLFYRIEELDDLRSAVEEDDHEKSLVLMTQKHAAELELAGIPARSVGDLRWKVGTLQMLTRDGQLGCWRDNIDERLIHSIAIDLENLTG